jgi:2-polyprenyl-6-methoxyphenol hydroxylase-like FAD-dependent oxidoreductase
MSHQPDLEALLLDRIHRHPLVDLHRGVEAQAIDGAHGPLTVPPVRVHTRAAADEAARTFTGSLVLGCDGANSIVRRLLGVHVQDLRFTERRLVVDVRAATPLDTWDGVEQVCDPAHAATFIHVTDDRYRWEFQLRGGEDETGLLAATGMTLLLGALIVHRRAHDSVREAVPALARSPSPSPTSPSPEHRPSTDDPMAGPMPLSFGPLGMHAGARAGTGDGWRPTPPTGVMCAATR